MENNNHHQNIIDKRIEIQVGYRFRPTDHELITKYLMKKVRNQLSGPCDNLDIRDVKFYDHNPWDLTVLHTYAEGEPCYFFTSTNRKYPNGSRPDRKAGDGYWKPTGTEKIIMETDGTKEIGKKKSLDFYHGKYPDGAKTDWKMHEYRLDIKSAPPADPHHHSMMLDEWVLCRLYKKRDSNKNKSNSNDHDHDHDEAEQVSNGSLRHYSPEAERLNSEGEPQQPSPVILLEEAPNHGGYLSERLNLEGEPQQPSPVILLEKAPNHGGYLSERLNLEGEPQQPSPVILLEEAPNHGGYLSDALTPWMSSCDYDHNNQTMILSTHEVLPNISIFDDYYLNATNMFGGDGFLEDVVHRPWRNIVLDEHGHEEHGVHC